MLYRTDVISNLKSGTFWGLESNPQDHITKKLMLYNTKAFASWYSAFSRRDKLYNSVIVFFFGTIIKGGEILDAHGWRNTSTRLWFYMCILIVSQWPIGFHLMFLNTYTQSFFATQLIIIDAIVFSTVLWLRQTRQTDV